MFTCGAFGVYLRWFRLHSAGVSLSIPPVAPADVPAIPAQEFGHLPAVLQTFTCGAETRLPSGGCIPPVAVAQSLARRLPLENYLRCYHLRGGRTFVYTSGGSCGRACNTRPKNGTSTCGANINYTFFPKKCIFFKRRTQNVRFMCYLCSVNTK